MFPGTSEPLFGVYPEIQMSLQRCGAEEAQRFKWIRSEKAGRDLGEHAIRRGSASTGTASCGTAGSSTCRGRRSGLNWTKKISASLSESSVVLPCSTPSLIDSKS